MIQRKWKFCLKLTSTGQNSYIFIRNFSKICFKDNDYHIIIFGLANNDNHSFKELNGLKKVSLESGKTKMADIELNK